jgi:hypothetical protein
MERSVIHPTPGRVVWYYPDPQSAESGFARPREGQPLAALVAHVHSDSMVTLTVFDAQGVAHPRTSVPLVQDGDNIGPGSYCTWMPYQKGQAVKTETLEPHVRHIEEYLRSKSGYPSYFPAG